LLELLPSYATQYFFKFPRSLNMSFVGLVSDWRKYTFHHFWVINATWTTKLRSVLGWTGISLSLNVTKLGADVSAFPDCK
jgi:hypothetical protein